ncbi:MAG: FAD-dependent oxidoreductase [Rhodospirillales bacterium]|jgi:3-(3-hydroxy-phenyl)propionate hydroxylase
MNNVDRVIIAGAGPVGCASALYLAQNDIPVTLIEACDSLPEDLRASTFHSPTLEMLDDLGVVDKVIEQGLVCPIWQQRDTRDDWLVNWDLGVLKDDTNHPYRIQCEQFKLTRIIVAELEKMKNVEVLFNVKAVDADQDKHGVTLKVNTLDGHEELKGRYLIASDGASSAIRVSQDIKFPGLTFPELWLCVSSEFEFENHFENLAPVAYFAAEDFWFLLLRVPGLWRVLMPSNQGQTAEMLVQENSVQELMHRVVPIEGNFETVHRTAYPVHQRVAESYRSGRIFLAGDAAHINNPLGGMGMNGGVHDGINLSKKIVSVWRGDAEESLLDLYEKERLPVATEYVQKTTLRNKAMLEQNDSIARKARQKELSAVASNPMKAREYLLESSMIASFKN